MHWADVLAEQLIKEKKKHVLATGITPSGPIHIGNMREILTTDAVYRSLMKKGEDADFIYIADDFDPLRKVYPYLPKTYEKHVGKPISEIPCPCEEHKSYADHYLTSFLNSLEEIGVDPKLHRASKMYKNGEYNEVIQIALENTDKIRRIIEKISKRKLPKEWLPFNIRCGKCERITTAKPILYEYPIIEYKCDCGYEGEADIRKGGVGKLPWRVDWPARWKMLGVTFEPCGKDLATVGGARDTGAKIVEEVYDYPHPVLLVYEFIMLRGKGAMHSSKGTALSAEEMLKMTPPEVLRFLIMKNQPGKHIVFDSGLGLLSLVDEYDKEERVYFGKEEAAKGMKDLKKTYELSQPYGIPKAIPYQLPYRHLVTLIQIGQIWNDVKKILLRTGQIPKNLGKEDEKHLKQRAEHARYWLDNFAPDSEKFEVKKKMPKINLTEEQKRFLFSLGHALSQIRWDAENIHRTIYTVIGEWQQEGKKNAKNEGFKTIYQIILEKEKGPRAGYFLSNLDKQFVLERIAEAVK
ncbi:MAG: lysine--tRNA ligase [Thermoplasmatales archaeon]|nr:MAG: lysine--tRNA ligase [Thermoplasmatales archaeon]